MELEKVLAEKAISRMEFEEGFCMSFDKQRNVVFQHHYENPYNKEWKYYIEYSGETIGQLRIFGNRNEKRDRNLCYIVAEGDFLLKAYENFKKFDIEYEKVKREFEAL